MGEAVLGDGVACQVACLLLLEGDAVAVGGDGVGADVGLGHVDGDEAGVGVLLGSPCQGSAVQVADADDGVGAVVDGLADHGLAVLIGGVGLGDVVLAVLAHVVLDGGPACLVEALVVDGAGVAAQGDVGDGTALGGSLRGSSGRSCAGSGRGSAGSGAGRRTAAGGQNRNGSGCASHGHELTARNHIHKNSLLFYSWVQPFLDRQGCADIEAHSLYSSIAAKCVGRKLFCITKSLQYFRQIVKK